MSSTALVARRVALRYMCKNADASADRIFGEIRSLMAKPSWSFSDLKEFNGHMKALRTALRRSGSFWELVEAYGITPQRIRDKIDPGSRAFYRVDEIASVIEDHILPELDKKAEHIHDHLQRWPRTLYHKGKDRAKFLEANGFDARTMDALVKKAIASSRLTSLGRVNKLPRQEVPGWDQALTMLSGLFRHNDNYSVVNGFGPSISSSKRVTHTLLRILSKYIAAVYVESYMKVLEDALKA